MSTRDIDGVVRWDRPCDFTKGGVVVTIAELGMLLGRVVMVLCLKMSDVVAVLCVLLREVVVKLCFRLDVWGKGGVGKLVLNVIVDWQGLCMWGLEMGGGVEYRGRKKW